MYNGEELRIQQYVLARDGKEGGNQVQNAVDGIPERTISSAVATETRARVRNRY
jgi:hypothetical protein